MKVRILSFLVAILVSAVAAAAAPLDDGLNAAGRGDYPTAFRLLTPVAEAGNPDAQFALGVLYAEGRGVPANAGEAAEWYLRAAEQGLLEAQNNLGALYAAGEGVPHDHVEAYKWWSLAAERGFGRSQLNLAGLYLEGEGVSQDYVQAYKWALLAAVLGEAQAPKILDKVTRLMTPEQIAEGDRLVMEWQPTSTDPI